MTAEFWICFLLINYCGFNTDVTLFVFMVASSFAVSNGAHIPRTNVTSSPITSLPSLHNLTPLNLTNTTRKLYSNGIEVGLNRHKRSATTNLGSVCNPCQSTAYSLCDGRKTLTGSPDPTHAKDIRLKGPFPSPPPSSTLYQQAKEQVNTALTAVTWLLNHLNISLRGRSVGTTRERYGFPSVERDLEQLYGNVILIQDHLNVSILQRDQSHHHAEEAIIQRLRKLRIAYLGNVACSLYVLPGEELELPGKEEVFPCMAHTQPNNYFITRGSNRANRNYKDYVTLRFTQDVLREISAVLNEMSN